MDQPPPKADEQLAHSGYLPRMGKDSLLCALRASVVRGLCRGGTDRRKEPCSELLKDQALDAVSQDRDIEVDE